MPKHVDVFIPSWHQLKNFAVAFAPFSSSHFHSLITAKSLASQLLQWLKISFLHSCCVHIHPWFLGLTTVTFITDIRPFLNSAPFSKMLHSHYAITSMNMQWFSMGETCFTYKKEITLPWLSCQCRCHCTSTYPMYRIWLTDWPSSAC